jgi:aspartate aminotransferase
VILPISERVKRIKPSPTIAVTMRAAELKAAGHDVIGLGAGEPDFDTPEHIKQAAIQAIQDGFTKYTAVDGIVELKKAVIEKFRRDNELEYHLDQILVSTGAKQTIFNLCQAVLGAGDEVVIPAPYWVSYPDIVLLCDATPVSVFAGAEQGFKITPEQLAQALNSKTRMLIFNTPSNPTGVVYSRRELIALGEILNNFPNVIIATDDMYEHIYWGKEPFVSFAQACPQLYSRTVTINGVSKCYAMTGWRIGYCGGPEAIVKAMKKVQSQSTSNPCSISQKAAVAALTGDQSCLGLMAGAFKERHDFVVNSLNNVNGVTCLPSDGAFYAFPDVREAIENTPGVEDDMQLAEHLLMEAGLAFVPGSAFGAPGYLRLSYALDFKTLSDAMERLKQCLG